MDDETVIISDENKRYLDIGYTDGRRLGILQGKESAIKMSDGYIKALYEVEELINQLIEKYKDDVFAETEDGKSMIAMIEGA